MFIVRSAVPSIRLVELQRIEYQVLVQNQVHTEYELVYTGFKKPNLFCCVDEQMQPALPELAMKCPHLSSHICNYRT